MKSVHSPLLVTYLGGALLKQNLSAFHMFPLDSVKIAFKLVSWTNTRNMNESTIIWDPVIYALSDVKPTEYQYNIDLNIFYKRKHFLTLYVKRLLFYELANIGNLQIVHFTIERHR